MKLEVFLLLRKSHDLLLKQSHLGVGAFGESVFRELFGQLLLQFFSVNLLDHKLILELLFGGLLQVKNPLHFLQLRHNCLLVS